MDEKVKKAIKISMDRPEDNFDEICEVLGESGVEKLIKEGLFDDFCVCRTLRFTGA